ncbi:MAG: CAP domain-containing protein [Bacteroidales bacterium]|nr:CAP domain-containing protein [Bacteroidales bacterium]MCF8390173.1 CAP domain-containing protein [Bacteroidales bacterium]
MYKFTTILFLFFLGFSLSGQDPWAQWDADIINKANTAAGSSYLSKEEKEVILLTNLARYDGELFADSFLKEFLKDQKSTSYTRSLIRDLSKTKNLPMLHSEEDLYEIALGHAKISGQRNTTGHQRFEKRFEPVMGKYNAVAENCAYGFESALDNVLQLLVDEGISDLGHRKNMLNPDYNSIGVSIQNHKTYRFNCVMDFGRKQ